MAVLRLQGFAGAIPVTGDRAIPDGFATQSLNTWLYGGELRGVRPPVHLRTVQSTARRVLRIPKRTPGGDPDYPGVPPPSYLQDSVWKLFTDIDTDVVKGQLIEDSFERYYFCSPTRGPRFNTYARLAAGESDYKLGVPGPNVDIAEDGSNPAQPTIISITPLKKGKDVYEIEFKISAADTGGTSYSNPGGEGNRLGGSILVSGTMTFSGDKYRLINGVVDASGAGLYFTDLSAAGNTIIFDFTANRIIDEVRWIQADSTIYGDFTLEGSTDGATWVALGTAELGGAQEKSYSFANTTAYRYYQLKREEDSSLMITRAYLYTWVNEFGEESTPSLPVLGAGDTAGVWTIGNITEPVQPADYALYTHKFLYRTISGASGQTTYYRITQGTYADGTAIPEDGKIALDQTVVVDDTSVLTDAILANNLILESTAWDLPPANLAGFIAMPNGFLIGFDQPVLGEGGGNNIYMSESYHWHAWPAVYKQATETPIVGLGVFGQTCVVCTQGYPTAVTGTQPATCSFVKVTASEPCLSRGSIVSTTQGVVYGSQNGLILVSSAGISNVTEKLITKGEWLHDYAPQYLRAVRYQNGYLALRMYPESHTRSHQPRSGFFIDPSALEVALTDLTDFDDVLALNEDFWSGEVLLLREGVNIEQWDPPTHDLAAVLWKSKEFQYPLQENFGAYSLYWDQDRFDEAANLDPPGNQYAPSIMLPTEEVRLKVFADRQVVYDQRVPRNGRPVRLPSGFKADIWQFEIRARAPVYSLHVASTVKELKGV